MPRSKERKQSCMHYTNLYITSSAFVAGEPEMALFGKKEMEMKVPDDPFVTMMKTVRALPREKVAERMGELAKMCTCPQCPTYNECAKNAGEGLFCAHGTSFHCITEPKSCICPGCPVTKQAGLKHQAFCVMGSEMAQRYGAMIK